MTCSTNTACIGRTIISGVVLALLVLIPFVHFPGFTWEYTYLKQPLFQLVAVIGLLFLVLTLQHPVAWVKERVALLIPAAGLLALGFLSLLWHRYPWAAANALVRDATLFVGFVGLSFLLTSPRARRMFLWVIGAGALVAALMITYHMKMGRVTYFGNRNLAGGFLVLPLVVAIAYAPDMFRRRSRDSAFILAGTCLALIALYYTQTRGAWLGAGVGVFLLLCIYRPFLRTLLLTAAAGAAFCVLMILFLRSELLFDYIGIRTYIWQATLRMIDSAPLVGQGTGGFAAAVRQFQPVEYFAHPAAANATTDAHCHPLQLWAELGLGGVMLYVALLAGLFISARKAVRTFPGERTAVIAIACGLAGMATHGLLEIVSSTIDVQIYFWLGTAYICGAMADDSGKTRFRTVRLIPAAAVAAAAVFFFHSVALPALQTQRLMAHAERTDCPDKRLEMLEEAKRLQPFEDIVRNSLTAELRGRIASNQARRGGHDAAYAQYAELDALSDNLMGAAGLRARMALRMGEYASAAEHARRALRSNPYDTQLYDVWLASLDNGAAGPPPEEAVMLLAIAQETFVKFERYDPLLPLYQAAFLKHAGHTEHADQIFAMVVEIIKNRFAGAEHLAEKIGLLNFWMQAVTEWEDSEAFAEIVQALEGTITRYNLQDLPLFLMTALANYGAGNIELAERQFAVVKAECESRLVGYYQDDVKHLELLVKSCAVIDPERGIEAAHRLLQIDSGNPTARKILKGKID